MIQVFASHIYAFYKFIRVCSLHFVDSCVLLLKCIDVSSSLYLFFFLLFYTEPLIIIYFRHPTSPPFPSVALTLDSLNHPHPLSYPLQDWCLIHPDDPEGQILWYDAKKVILTHPHVAQPLTFPY